METFNQKKQKKKKGNVLQCPERGVSTTTERFEIFQSTRAGGDEGDRDSERENTNVSSGSCDLLFFTTNAKRAHRCQVSWNKESRAFLASSLTSGKAGDVAAPLGFQLESRHKVSVIWQICTLSFPVLFATIVIEPL